MNNKFITGQFKSSFSTALIGKFEKPVVDVRAIELLRKKSAA